MAIQPGGDGSQANPYVIDNSDGLAWNNFNTLNDYNNKGKYITFADVHVDGNGNFDISGTGTSADPYIVSTYREMLYATGASNVHKCKLIDNTLPNRELLYRYDSENPETHVVSSIYCRYNPAPTTIDYNDISTDYRGHIRIYEHCDLNGWTLLNFKISLTDNSNWSGIFSSGDTQNDKAEIYNAFALNLQAKVNSDDWRMSLFNVNTHDCIMHIEVDATILSSTYSFGMAYSPSYGHGFSRNSLALTVIGDCGFSGYTYTNNQYNIEDSTVDLDLDIKGYGDIYSPYSGLGLIRTTLKGKYKFTTVGTNFIESCTDSIYDVESISSETTPAPHVSGTRCIFNSDKVSWSQTGWEGISSKNLLSPSWLQEHTDFPIGVDT